MLTEQKTHRLRPRSRSKPSGLPGGWQAALIAVISAMLVGYWARPGNSAPRAQSRTATSRVAEVAPEDSTAALGTLSESAQQLAQIDQRDACSRKLAWVTVARAPGRPPGRIRLQSGRYVSPAFDLEETPVRVAIPYPAPYSTGRGSILVIGATTEAIVALTPPWHVPAQAELAAREVSWTPVGGCPGASK